MLYGWGVGGARTLPLENHINSACGLGTKKLLIVAVYSPADAPFGPLAGKTFYRVAVFDARSATPSLALMRLYDAVLAYSNFVPDNPDLLGDRLADYADSSGPVVVATYGLSNPPLGIKGRIMRGPGYSPLHNVGFNGDPSGNINAVLPLQRKVSSRNVPTVFDNFCYGNDLCSLAGARYGCRRDSASWTWT